jgi:GMP synthase (glutamine-hydrolysing)
VQGTNQADKVESGRGGKKHSGSAHIKTHHNVGSFVDKYRTAGHLLEPMDRFFKPDIYELGKRYSLSDFFSHRKPFPGPGLLIRIGNHNMLESGKYNKKDIGELSLIANDYSKRHGVITYVTPIEAVGTCGDERAEGVMAILQSNNFHHEANLIDNLNNLLHVAGQLPHHTTFSRNKCITRCLTPLVGFDAFKTPTFTLAKHDGRCVEALQLFDNDVNKIVDDLGIKMTQVVNYMINDNLGQDGKYTFVFRPWQAPDLMTGMTLIPDYGTTSKLIDRLKKLKAKYDFIGNVCIDLTYKPIGGTEIN